jgi:large subunit ribosomal protein L24
MERGCKDCTICTMKREFSTSWISSKLPRKQRKYLANAPLHKKHKFLSANLSEELRKKHSKRSLPLRKGDEVLVMRGSFKRKKAKVSLISLKKSIVFIEGIQRTKKDGTKVNVPFSPSNLQITSLFDDRLRISKSQKSKESKEKDSKEIEKSKSIKSNQESKTKEN